MKKNVLLLLFLIGSCLLSATTVKTVKINIDLSGLTFPCDTYGQTQIIPKCGTFTFDENGPCLPFYPVSVYIADGSSKYIDASLDYKELLMFSNCTLAPAPEVLPTSNSGNLIDRVSRFDNDIYPKDNVRYTGESKIDNSKVIYFNVCPFVYDNKNKKLSVMSNIKINIRLDENKEGINKIASIPFDPSQRELVKDLVINSEDLNF